MGFIHRMQFAVRNGWQATSFHLKCSEAAGTAGGKRESRVRNKQRLTLRVHSELAVVVCSLKFFHRHYSSTQLGG